MIALLIFDSGIPPQNRGAHIHVCVIQIGYLLINMSSVGCEYRLNGNEKRSYLNGAIWKRWSACALFRELWEFPGSAEAVPVKRL